MRGAQRETGFPEEGVPPEGMSRIEGVVVARWPSGLYQVEIEGPRRITAHVGAGKGRNFVRLLVGDRVAVELTPRNLTRGRIVERL
jgi:translation initiation factor IF-1